MSDQYTDNFMQELHAHILLLNLLFGRVPGSAFKDIVRHPTALLDKASLELFSVIVSSSSMSHISAHMGCSSIYIISQFTYSVASQLIPCQQLSKVGSQHNSPSSLRAGIAGGGNHMMHPSQKQILM